MGTRLHYVAHKAVASHRKQEDETVHYVHCRLIVRGCVNTAWSIVAGKVESKVIPISVIEAGVHGVSILTTPFACMYKSTVSQHGRSKWHEMYQNIWWNCLNMQMYTTQHYMFSTNAAQNHMKSFWTHDTIVQRRKTHNNQVNTCSELLFRITRIGSKHVSLFFIYANL